MSCLFCRIVDGEIPSDVCAVRENAIAIRDIAPAAPSHLLVIPKRHFENLTTFMQGSDAASVAQLFGFAAELGSALDGGYRLVVNTGIRGGQTVGHLHLHVLGGRTLEWPPG